MSQTVFEQLTAIAEDGKAKGLFTHYQDDLYQHDRDELAAAFAGDEFIWMLKTCGTYMARVKGGDFARESLRYALKSCSGDLYHVAITGPKGQGTVKPISTDAAEKLLEDAPAYTVKHICDDRYFVVETNNENALAAECQFVDNRAQGYAVEVTAVGAPCARKERDLTQIVVDSVVGMSGSLLTPIQTLDFRFADQLTLS